VGMTTFIVQESTHADHVSRHRTRDEAVAAIEEMLREGLAEPGEFNIREIDDAGETVPGLRSAGRRTAGTDRSRLSARS
jgi:hypothetical protein